MVKMGAFYKGITPLEIFVEIILLIVMFIIVALIHAASNPLRKHWPSDPVIRKEATEFGVLWVAVFTMFCGPVGMLFTGIAITYYKFRNQ